MCNEKRHSSLRRMMIFCISGVMIELQIKNKKVPQGCARLNTQTRGSYPLRFFISVLFLMASEVQLSLRTGGQLKKKKGGKRRRRERRGGGVRMQEVEKNQEREKRKGEQKKGN